MIERRPDLGEKIAPKLKVGFQKNLIRKGGMCFE